MSRFQPPIVVDMDRLFDKPPPHSLELEASLLGAMMYDPSIVADVANILPGPEAFFAERHATLYGAMLTSMDRNGVLNLASLQEALRANGTLEGIGGLAYIDKLVRETPGPAAYTYFAREVADKHQRRELIAAAGRLAYDAHHSPKHPLEIAGEAAGRMSGTHAGGSGVVTLSEAIDRVMVSLKSGRPTFMEVGIPVFDSAFGGIPKGKLSTFMGGPASGKTTLVVQSLLHQTGLGRRALIFSNEQNAESIACTLLTMVSRVAVNDKIGRGNATPQEVEIVEAAGQTIAGLPFEMVEESMSAARIYAMCRLAQRRGVEIVAIDYIQDLPPPEGFTSGVETMRENMRQLKRIPRELGLTTIVVSQLDKATCKENRRPTMYDGQYSASIEQATDFMVSTYREFQNEATPVRGDRDSWTYDAELSAWKDRKRMCEVSVLKNKATGRTGTVFLAQHPDAKTYEEAGQ